MDFSRLTKEKALDSILSQIDSFEGNKIKKLLGDKNGKLTMMVLSSKTSPDEILEDETSKKEPLFSEDETSLADKVEDSKEEIESYGASELAELLKKTRGLKREI